MGYNDPRSYDVYLFQEKSGKSFSTIVTNLFFLNCTSKYHVMSTGSFGNRRA